LQQEESPVFTHIILKATEGELQGQEFILHDETQWTVGRSHNCTVRLPDTADQVSRRHCSIEVEAPSVRVRDLGSLNGTFVNGVLIGQRNQDQTVESALNETQAAHTLFEGDELRVGDIVFRVEFSPRTSGDEAEARDQENLAGCECEVCG
jgi:pSer/pThr/pTyr-binding forkhead associated (FHA) protein